MGRWLALVGVLALFTIGALAFLKVRTPGKTASAEALAHAGRASLEPLFEAPGFGYVDHHGERVSNQSLRGRVWVANFIFTTCRTVCPLLTARMVQVQRKVTSPEVRFVSFSVDPERDTPEALAAYAQRWAPEERRWVLLATDAKTLPFVAAGFHVIAEKNKPGELDPIVHSSVFVLVDQQGIVRGVYDSEQRAALDDLVRGVTTLSQSVAVAEQAGPVSGVELYHSESCVTCHEAKELAPALLGRAGSRVTFENGISVPFDAEYVKESLLAPDAKRAKGYPLRMPSYDHLSAGALNALVRYVLEAPAAPPVVEDAKLEVDPVCHMQVRASGDALQTEVNGKTYFFCSQHCRTRFVDQPAAFLRDAGL